MNGTTDGIGYIEAQAVTRSNSIRVTECRTLTSPDGTVTDASHIFTTGPSGHATVEDFQIQARQRWQIYARNFDLTPRGVAYTLKTPQSSTVARWTLRTYARTVELLEVTAL